MTTKTPILIGKTQENYEAITMNESFHQRTFQDVVKRALLHAFSFNKTKLELTLSNELQKEITQACCQQAICNLEHLFQEVRVSRNELSRDDFSTASINATQRFIRKEQLLETQRQAREMMSEVAVTSDASTKMITPMTIDSLPPAEKQFAQSYDVERRSNGWMVRNALQVAPMSTAANRQFTKGYTAVYAEINDELSRFEAGEEMRRYYGRPGEPGNFPGTPEQALEELRGISSSLQELQPVRQMKVFELLADGEWQQDFRKTLPDDRDQAREELEKVLQEEPAQKQKEIRTFKAFHFLKDFHEGFCPGCLENLKTLQAQEAYCRKCGVDVDPAAHFSKWSQNGHMQPLLSKIDNSFIEVLEKELEVIKRFDDLESRLFLRDPHGKSKVFNQRRMRLHALRGDAEEAFSRRKRKLYQALSYFKTVKTQYERQLFRVQQENEKTRNTRALGKLIEAIGVSGSTVMTLSECNFSAIYTDLFDLTAAKRIEHWLGWSAGLLTSNVVRSLRLVQDWTGVNLPVRRVCARMIALVLSTSEGRDLDWKLHEVVWALHHPEKASVHSPHLYADVTAWAEGAVLGPKEHLLLTRLINQRGRFVQALRKNNFSLFS